MLCCLHVFHFVSGVFRVTLALFCLFPLFCILHGMGPQAPDVDGPAGMGPRGLKRRGLCCFILLLSVLCVCVLSFTLVCERKTPTIVHLGGTCSAREARKDARGWDLREETGALESLKQTDRRLRGGAPMLLTHRAGLCPLTRASGDRSFERGC